MVVWILIFFAFVFVLVLAFSSSTKKTTVRKIDPKTGQETIEIHEVNSPSEAKQAARVVMWIIGIIVVAIFILAILVSVENSAPLFYIFDLP